MHLIRKSWLCPEFVYNASKKKLMVKASEMVHDMLLEETAEMICKGGHYIDSKNKEPLELKYCIYIYMPFKQ